MCNIKYDASVPDQIYLVQAEVLGYAYQGISLRVVDGNGQKTLKKYCGATRGNKNMLGNAPNGEFSIAERYAQDICSKILNQTEKMRYGLYANEVQQ